MAGLYARFVQPGDLVFDIGAHVGDRTATLRRLGARVVAVEPQPDCARLLRLMFGRDRSTAIVAAAIDAAPGRVQLHLNRRNPTTSTASADFIAGAQHAAGWQGQRWNEIAEVPATTLDALIAEHGMPAFIKIDVEGYELPALLGLSRAARCVSFEFTTMQRAAIRPCVERLLALGAYRFTYALGETQRLAHYDPVEAEQLLDELAALPNEANSGDVYALLAPPVIAGSAHGGDT